MADTKISDMTAATTLGDTDELALAVSGANKKITGANLKSSVLAGASSGALTLLSTTTLVSTTTFDVSSISGSYNDLILVAITRGSGSNIADDVAIRFNGDTGSNYADVYYIASASTIGAAQDNTQTSMKIAETYSANAAASFFSFHEIWIHGYASTTWKKVARSHSSEGRSLASGDTSMKEFMGIWNNTAAINRVQLFPTSGSFISGSVLRIYGRL